MDLSYLAPLIGVLIGYYISLQKNKVDRSDKYFFAALDKKIKAHQEAYNLVWDLPSAAHKYNGYDKIINSCEEWYRNNCLYLEPKSRKAFYLAYMTAWNYESQLNAWRDTQNDKKIEEEWSKIVNASVIIEENVSVHLIRPKSINESEYNSKGVMNDL